MVTKTATAAPSDDGDNEQIKKAPARKKISFNDKIRARVEKDGGKADWERFEAPVLIKSGIPELDKILTGKDGIGYKTGTILEFAGPSQSGKTYASAKHAIEHMKLNRRVIYCDAEGTFNENRFKTIGVDTSNGDLFVKIDKMGCAESWANFIVDMIDNTDEYGETGLFILDSIKAFIPSAEYTKKFDANRNTFAHPAFIRDFLSRILQKCQQKDVSVILINHMVSTAGAMPHTWVKGTSGGTAIDHLTRYRLWFKQRGGKAGHIMDVKEGVTTRIGVRSNVNVVKTLTSTPLLDTDFDIMFDKDDFNQVADFVYRAMSSKGEYIRRSGRKPNYAYRFVDPFTAEILAEAGTDYELVEQLITCPTISRMTKADKSETGFEYICGRLKIKEDARQLIIDKLTQIKSGEFIPGELDDFNPYEGLEVEGDDGEEDAPA